MCFLKSDSTIIASYSIYIIDNYFVAVKNYGVRIKLTTVLCFFHYIVKVVYSAHVFRSLLTTVLCFFHYIVESTYQLFSTLPIYKPES